MKKNSEFGKGIEEQSDERIGYFSNQPTNSFEYLDLGSLVAFNNNNNTQLITGHMSVGNIK